MSKTNKTEPKVAKPQKAFNNSLFKSNTAFRVYQSEFKKHWGVMLIYAIIWLAITLTCLGLTFIHFEALPEGKHLPFIGKYDQLTIHDDGTNKSTSTDSLLGIGAMANQTIFGTTGIFFFVLYQILFWNKAVNNEIKTNTLATSLSLPIQKTAIVNGKSLTLIINMLIIFLPSFLSTMIFGAIGSNSGQEIGNLALLGVEFFLFVLFLGLLFGLISVLMGDKILVMNLIFGLIGIYLIATVVLKTIYDSSNIEWLNFSPYIALSSLIVNTLEYSSDSSMIIGDSDPTYKLIQYDHLSYSTIFIIIFPIALLALSILFYWLISLIFKHKQFNV